MKQTVIDAHTTLCCLIGNPVTHSLSPVLHNACFRRCNLNWVYVAFRVDDIAGAIAGIRALGIRGASVTIPHKISAMKYLDAVDEKAKTIGSINTIVNDSGKLHGFNYDGLGALQALREQGHDPTGKRVVVLGSGGAARAVCVTLALDARPQNLTIMGIVPDEMASLERDIRTVSDIAIQTAFLNTDNLRQVLAGADIVINCTPVGMFPDVSESPVPSELLHSRHVVFDIVYNPLETRLLSDARRAGAATVSGVEMFLNQAALQFELWTGIQAPREVMRAVVLRHLTPRRRRGRQR